MLRKDCLTYGTLLALDDNAADENRCRYEGWATLARETGVGPREPVA